MNNRWLCLLMCALYFIPGYTRVFAQLSMTAFLQSAHTSTDLNSLDAQIQYLDSKPYRLFPIQKMEFRTESNQLDPSRQDYGLRFNPANPWEVRSNAQYYEQFKSVLSTKKNLALKEALTVRYNMIVRLLYFEAMKSVQEENQRLIATQLAVLDKQRQSDFFDGEDFVELKLDQIDQDVELQEVSFEFENQLRKMAGLYPAIGRQQIDWNFGQILSVDRVGIIVDSLYDQQAVPTTLLYREQQIELAHRELQLEKSNVNIGFLQTQYQPYRIEQDRNPWSISLGVTIPIANPNKGDMTKRRLEVIEAEHKRTDTESAIQVDQMVAREQLRSLIARYREIRKKTEALDVPGLSGSLQAMKENNPVVSLRLAGNVLKLKMLEVKIRQNILLTYIAFLGYTDVIQREPLINFLTDELEHIGW